MVNHGLLSRNQMFRVQALYGDDMLAVGIAQWRQAGYNALVMDAVVFQLPFQHRACPAVAFAAADFGAGQVFVVTDEIQQGRAGVMVRADFLIIENESNHDLSFL